MKRRFIFTSETFVLLPAAGSLQGQWQAVGILDGYARSADGIELRAGGTSRLPLFCEDS